MPVLGLDDRHCVENTVLDHYVDVRGVAVASKLEALFRFVVVMVVLNQQCLVRMFVGVCVCVCSCVCVCVCVCVHPRARALLRARVRYSCPVCCELVQVHDSPLFLMDEAYAPQTFMLPRDCRGAEHGSDS